MDPQYTAKFLDDIRATAPDADTTGGHRDTLLKAYGAVIRGDFEALGDLLAEDAELDIRGLGAMDGTWRGRMQVMEAARLNFGQLTEQKPEVESVIEQGDAIAVLFRESGVFKLDRRSYRFRVVQWFTFANGKVKRIDEIAAQHLVQP